MIPRASQAISLLTKLNGAGGTLSDCGCIQRLPSCIFYGIACVLNDVFKKQNFDYIRSYFVGWHSGPSLMPGRGMGKGPGPRGFAPHLDVDNEDDEDDDDGGKDDEGGRDPDQADLHHIWMKMSTMRMMVRVVVMKIWLITW